MKGGARRKHRLVRLGIAVGAAVILGLGVAAVTAAAGKSTELVPALAEIRGIRDAADMTLVVQIGGECWAAHISGTYAYVGIGPRLVVVDVSDPQEPETLG